MDDIKNDLINEAASQTNAKLYLNEDFADVKFIFEEIDGEIQKVPANKAILAVLSPVFNAMLYGPNKDDDDVKIVDATIDTFKEFLQFFYLNKVSIAMKNMKDVVRLADKYLVLEHVNNAVLLLDNKLTLENMCWGYQLSLLLGNEIIKKTCEKFISKYPNEVFKSATFKQCDQLVLKHILELNSMACKEYEIFDACLVWAESSCKRNGINENKPENLKAQLGECFNLIRFGAMTPEEFATHSMPYRDMFSEKELADIFYATTVKDSNPSSVIQEPRSLPTFEWNNDQQLDCLQVDTSIDKMFSQILRHISAYFSVNYPVLLGKIYFYHLESNKSTSISAEFKVNIIEYDDQSIKSSKKIISSHDFIYENSQSTFPCIVLPQPILINPQKMYEISWEITSSSQLFSSIFYYFSTNSVITLDQGLIVKFHNFYNNVNITGLLSRLCFNRL